MNDIGTYLIELRGQVDEAQVNAGSPILMTVRQARIASTLLAARTDQSGLIGLLRHLHGLGLVLLSLRYER